MLVYNISDIESIFNSLNRLVFDSELPMVKIEIDDAKGYIGRLECRKRIDKFGNVTGHSDFVMKISRSRSLDRNQLEDVILHEMIHYYIDYYNLHDDSQHGGIFKSMMFQINRTYGRNVKVLYDEGNEDNVYGNYKVICVTSFYNGTYGITNCARTKMHDFYRIFNSSRDIQKVEWYYTSNPFFDRYSRSRTPKIYAISKDVLMANIQSAKRIRYDGFSAEIED